MFQRASIAICGAGTGHVKVGPMKLPEGASEWACPRKKSGKSQRFSVRISSVEGLLVYGGEFTLIFPVGPVKPFHTQFRGERLEVASMDAGGSKIPGVVPQTTIKNDGSPGTLRCRSRFAFYIFCFRDPRRSRAGRILMRFKGLFSRGKVTGA